MNVFLSFTREPGFDFQKDVDLECGTVMFSEGPDRAYLRLAGGTELLALWQLDTPEAGLSIARAIDTPLPAGSEVRPFDILWIKGGQVAAAQAIGADAGMWLMTQLAAENLLDYEASLFDCEFVDGG